MDELEFTKLDWEKARAENVNLIIGNKIQIEMAKRVIKLCDEKIKEFPEENMEEEEKTPEEEEKSEESEE